MRPVLSLAAMTAALAAACSLGLHESMVHGSTGAGGATSGTADGGSTGTCACLPGACGDNGCMSSCGGCPGAERCVGLVCQNCDPWRKSPSHVHGLAHVALQPDALFVGASDGNNAQSVWIGTFDLCSGTSTGVDEPGPTTASLGSGTVAANEQYVFYSGKQTSNQIFVAAAPRGHRAPWSQLITSSTATDQILDLAAASDGDVWAVGRHGAGTPWRIKLRGDGNGYCEFTDTSMSVSSAAVRDGASVIVATTFGGSLGLARYDDGCPTAPPCNCAPSQETSAPVSFGSAMTAYGMAILQGGIYVSGAYTQDGNFWEGFVARFDDATFNHEATLHYHPSTGQNDGLIGIATDGNALFVGGVTKWNGIGDFKVGTGILGGVAPNFHDGETDLLFSKTQSLANVTWLAADVTGLYAAGTTASGALSVMTCTKNGDCAP